MVRRRRPCVRVSRRERKTTTGRPWKRRPTTACDARCLRRRRNFRKPPEPARVERSRRRRTGRPARHETHDVVVAYRNHRPCRCRARRPRHGLFSNSFAFFPRSSFALRLFSRFEVKDFCCFFFFLRNGVKKMLQTPLGQFEVMGGGGKPLTELCVQILLGSHGNYYTRSVTC